ncbi:unnamed protein product [Trichogramma brassicae]|uniref:Uncharacterized protein n=1 Tax=Trichogramma brassicae TaxID=86971 RepID=A0A6H5HXN8_9HYME|nr:unnamed protein product [Trichogramma brassicae]
MELEKIPATRAARVHRLKEINFQCKKLSLRAGVEKSLREKKGGPMMMMHTLLRRQDAVARRRRELLPLLPLLPLRC